MTAMQQAFDRASGEKTPWNPSRRAIARVKNPLPAPTECPRCGGRHVDIARNSEIYGRDYGEWPWAFLCRGCGAYVGMHPFTGIPLGTLADAPTREARKRAKAAFNPLWQSGAMTRTEAYSWLASRLGVAVAACHIGWFDVAMCQLVEHECLTIASSSRRRNSSSDAAQPPRSRSGQ